MKMLVVLWLWVWVWAAGAARGERGPAPVPCCAGGALLRRGGYCGSQRARLPLNCSAGHMLLRDVRLDGTKLSTADAPGFVFAEDPAQYCVGSMAVNASAPGAGAGAVPVAVVCFEASVGGAGDERADVQATGVLTLVSAGFLAATLAVYASLPRLRDLQGLTYVSLCVSMALGFLSLGVLQLSPGFSGHVCAATGFLVYFWMMATFFWMNVICVHMFRTIARAGGAGGAGGPQRSAGAQFARYSCYAWGGALLFLLIALAANYSAGDHWKPGFDAYSCWFPGRTETWIFFYGPIALLLGANVALFALSSARLWRRQHRYEPNKLDILKRKFLLSLKLFLVMGISWVFEIASFAHGQAHVIWTIMDTFNCLQGVIIFVLLVLLRRRVLRALLQAAAGEGAGAGQGGAGGACRRLAGRALAKLAPRDEPDDDDECMLPAEPEPAPAPADSAPGAPAPPALR